MGKKKSGRTGGIRVEVKSNAGESIKSVTQSSSRTAVNPSVATSNTVGAPKAPSNTAIIKTGSMDNIALEVDVESALEKLMSKVNDEMSLKTFAQSWNKSMSEKQELKKSNTDVSYEEFEKLISAKKLDSNLKKCTGFVRKMKQYSESQKTSIENDVKVLNLTKYLTEITAAVTEARFKVADIQDVVTICSWIHQRYSEFAPMLLENYKKTFPGKKTDLTGAVLSKLSVDLRMIGDLVACGVLPTGEGFSVVANVIRNMIVMDKEGTQCIVPVLSFCRGLGDDFIGYIPRSITDLCEEYQVDLIRSQVFPKEKKALFRDMVTDYFSTVLKALEKMNQDVINSELHNRRLLKSKGEIPVDRKEAHLGITNKFDKFYSSVVKFADIMNQKMPQLPSLAADPDEEEEKAMLLTESGEQLTSVPGIVVFEDEETRSFYQDFKDLKVYLPPVAYRDSIQQAAEQTQAIEEREKALDNFDDELEEAELQGESSVDDEVNPDAEEEVLPSMLNEKEEKEIDQQIKPSFQAFLTQLPNNVNRNMIDKAAVEFAENFNTKTNRKKLVNTLFRVPRQRMDLLPFYARFVAILNPVMPDIGIELCEKLSKDFRFLVRKKHQIFVETKVKITRFIGELVNFRIFPKSDALRCFKILLMDFVHHQVEMACVFVETCGRILYRTPDSHRRMKIYLEEMMRKKVVKSMEPRYVSLIDHAYYFVLPPEGVQKVITIKPPLECYLEELLINGLEKKTVNFTIEKLLKMDWESEEACEVGIRYLSMPWNITHQQFPLFAQILVGLYKWEPQIVIQIVDILLEEVRRGIEHPSVRNNHRRVATVQYICEMYYWRILTSNTIFCALYYMISFGVNLDPSTPSNLDPEDNLFRIRLACLLLKECGTYLKTAKYKKRLRTYLLYLQRYFWFKRTLPIWKSRDFPYGIQETWEETAKELNRKMIFATNYEEAVAAVVEVETELQEKQEVRDSEMAQKLRRIGRPKPELNNRSFSLLPISEQYEQGNLYDDRNGDTESSERDVSDSLQEYSEDFSKSDDTEHPHMWQQSYDDGDSKFGSEPLFGQGNGWGGKESLAHLPEEFLQNPNEGPLDPYEDNFERATAAMKAAQDNVTAEDEEEFNALLERMCSEVNYSATRDGGKHMKTDIQIPLHIRNSSHSNSGIFGNPGSPRSTGSSDNATVPFVLITRKGKKQDYKNLPIPVDSDFVKRIKSREEAEREEKESVKRRTLAINKLQEAEEQEQEAFKASMERKNITSGLFGNECKGELDSTSESASELEPWLENLSETNHSKHAKWLSSQRNRAIETSISKHERKMAGFKKSKRK